MTQIIANITKGTYRGKLVTGPFRLVKGYVDGARGGYITVMNPDHEAGTPECQRIQVSADSFVLEDINGDELGAHIVVPGQSDTAGQLTALSTDYERVFMETETEDEAMSRIAGTFSMLDKITEAAAAGHVRGLVVSGPPGIGKSFGVEKQLDTANMFRKLEGKDPLYEVISGGISAVGLYQKLYHNRAAKQVTVFDDCDEVLEDSEMLNLLKAALNSGEKRRICWNKESRALLSADIPNAFDFEGSVLFLSNKDFDREIARGSRMSAHLSAIMSRCHVLDLEIGSMRDRLLRIKQIIRDGMLAPYEFTTAQEDEIVAFTFTNAEFLHEVSLRMVKKIADFVKASPLEWYEMAEATCVKREAKFKRLLEKKNAAKALELEAAIVA